MVVIQYFLGELVFVYHFISNFNNDNYCTYLNKVRNSINKLNIIYFSSIAIYCILLSTLCIYPIIIYIIFVFSLHIQRIRPEINHTSDLLPSVLRSGSSSKISCFLRDILSKVIHYYAKLLHF